jgi:hypothetical protein
MKTLEFRGGAGFHGKKAAPASWFHFGSHVSFR